MRTVFTLIRPLPAREEAQNRYRIDGKKMDKELVLRLLKEAGHKITTVQETSKLVARKYKGIKIGSMHHGMVVWAKDEKETEKLYKLLTLDRFVEHPCFNFPVGKS